MDLRWERDFEREDDRVEGTFISAGVKRRWSAVGATACWGVFVGPAVVGTTPWFLGIGASRDCERWTIAG